MDSADLALTDPQAFLDTISWWSLLAAFIFGVVGLYLFIHGKKRINFWWIWIGVALMIYPIFISSAWLNWFLGFAFCGVAYWKREN